MAKYIKFIEGYVSNGNSLDISILSVVNMFDFYLSKKILSNGIERITIIFFSLDEEIKLIYNTSYVTIFIDFFLSMQLI